jgi:ubiquitin C-terminal hydrolase
MFVRYHLQHFWSRFGSGQTVYTYRCNHCQQISQTNADFTEIILSFPQDKSSISLNELIHRDFGMEQLDDKLCANCNKSDTSEVTTSIHTHPEVLIIMLKHHEYINNKPGRVNTRVDFPINGFVPNQGFDNVEMTMEYNLFAAICHKESRDKTPGHYTAQCKIKDSNNHWIKYNNADFGSNNFINQKNRTKAKVKYYPLVYFLFYIKKSDAVSPEIGL